MTDGYLKRENLKQTELHFDWTTIKTIRSTNKIAQFVNTY